MEKPLMSPEEVALCNQIASGGPPYNQRARALLMLAVGASQAEAAAQSGLTENQVRYWWGRFRSRRLAVFPEAMLTAVPEPANSLDEVITEAAGSVVIEESAGGVETAVAAKSKKKKKAASKKQKKGQKEKGKKKGTNKKKKKEGKKKSAKKKESKKKKSSKKGGKGKSKGSKKKTKKK